jgi:hypothetical protein
MTKQAGFVAKLQLRADFCNRHKLMGEKLRQIRLLSAENRDRFATKRTSATKLNKLRMEAIK